MVWDVQSGRAALTLKGYTDDVVAVKYSPNGRYIASGGVDKALILWDALTGETLRKNTEWDVGQCQVNILLVTVGQGDWHVPLYGELLDNRSGNSNAAQRIAVLQVCLDLLGRERIGLVLGDREFVGHSWPKWLQDNKLNFVRRLPRQKLQPARLGHPAPNHPAKYPHQRPGPTSRSIIGLANQASCLLSDTCENRRVE